MKIAKTCTKCGEMKRMDEYNRDKSSRDQRQYWCKSCSSAADRKRRRDESAEFFEGNATVAEVRLWANGLGFNLPPTGRNREVLINRFNREHPHRPYLPLPERD